MPINRKLEYTVLDMIESATRNSRAAPLNLGGFAGAGGGVGGPPGGFIGRLPQYQVGYDTYEIETMDTLPSGEVGNSGWSLVDNLNHIRYRLRAIEDGVSISGIVVVDDNIPSTFNNIFTLHFTGDPVSVTSLGTGQVEISISGGSSAFSGIIVIDDNGSLTYNNIDTLHFVGSGVTVIDLGGGELQVEINATGSGVDSFLDLIDTPDSYLGQQGKFVVVNSGETALEFATIVPGSGIEEAPFTGDTYGRNNGTWVIVSGGSGVEEAPIDGNRYERQDGAWVIASGGGTVISGIEEAPVDGNIYGRQNESWVTISGTTTSGELILHKYNDDLTSQIPSNTFTTSLVYISGTLRVYYNGIRQRKGIHYTDDIEFNVFSTYFDTYSGDSMVVDYNYYESSQGGGGGGEFSLVDGDGILLVDSEGVELI